VGSGKTALVRQLCIELRDKLPLAVVTNDIFTRYGQKCDFSYTCSSSALSRSPLALQRHLNLT